MEVDVKQKNIQNIELRKQLSSKKKNPAVTPKSDIKIDTLNGKKEVITRFKDNVENFGISTEAIFRILDTDCQG